MKELAFVWGTACVAVGVLALTPQSTLADDLRAAVEKARSAAERFQSVDVALAEGYIPDPNGHCVTAANEGLPPELGGMGIHYLHPALLGITATSPRVDGTSTHTDFEKPAILMYEPRSDGSLVLVGVENLVFKKAWEAAGNTQPPVFAGRTWDHMEDDPNTPMDEAHGFEPHYDQHIYFFDGDAEAAVRPFHASVTCEHHPGH